VIVATHDTALAEAVSDATLTLRSGVATSGAAGASGAAASGSGAAGASGTAGGAGAIGGGA